MTEKFILDPATKRRTYWVAEIQKLSGAFGEDSTRLEKELSEEINAGGGEALRDHLRLCGALPESYGHDSTEEKQYSKYTDALLAIAFKTVGITSLVLKGRADSADVECVTPEFSFVADAKAFRLSRTAKNQKDFKVQAMDGWKRGKPYAMVVCPIYQLPSRESQIYEQAATRDVCIFTYSHLSLLSSFAEKAGHKKAQALLLDIFKTVTALNPSKEAVSYWQPINRAILAYSDQIPALWGIEKRAALESIAIAKEEALIYLAKEREKIMLMSHDQAIQELIRVHKIDSKIRVINSVADNGLLSIA